MFKKVAISAALWTLIAIVTILLFFAMLFFTVALFPFDRKRKVAHAQCYWWADALTTLNPYWRISATGLENIDRNKAYVIVANHRSLADIAIVYKSRMQFKWVAKESLFGVPFVGWNMSLAKHIKLKRGSFSSIKHVYREAALWLRDGMSVLFFPEGTRSETDQMRDFQNGAFKLAIKEGVPVLPLKIEGSGDAIPKGSWIFTTKVSGNLKVLPPIDTSVFRPAEFSRLRDLARSMLEAS